MLSQVFPGLETETNSWSKTFPLVTVALILRSNPIEKIERELNKLSWTSEEINRIVFLLSLLSLSEENVYELRKKMDSIKFYYDEEIIEFAELSGMDKNLILAFLEYKPSISSKELIDLGFKGPELGKEIKRREGLGFKKILDKR